MKKLLNDILFYHELTITQDKKAWINNYETDYDFAYFLITCGIIDQDSGNFETGEKHYIIDFYSMNIFERINEIKNRLSISFTYSLHIEMRQQLLKDLDEIELQYNRLNKLKKLNTI